MHKWEEARDDYDRQRGHHDMTWQRQILAAQAISVRGRFIIYDLRKSSPNRGVLAFSCSISGNAGRQDPYQSDTVVVCGEQSQPPGIDVPAPQGYVTDQVLVSDAIQKACAVAVREMAQKAVLPADVRSATD